MTATRSGIPTTYRSANFRSRLEARWAVFFDLVGWTWTYEPLDLAGYIPDFLIHGNRPLLIEVGPAATRSEYEAKSVKAFAIEKPYDLLVVGLSPILEEEASGWMNHPTAGLLSDDEWGEGDAAWHVCRMCNGTAIHSVFGSFTGRPCGHYDGDNYLGGISAELIRELWNRAGSDTQWKPA